MNRYATSHVSSYGRVPARRLAPPSASAKASTRTGSLLQWTSLLARLLRATSERASTLFVWLFGSENGLTIGPFCNVCNDVHATGHQCHRAIVATCEDCRLRRTRDKYGRCSCGSSSMSNPQLKFPNAHRFNAAMAKSGKALAALLIVGLLVTGCKKAPDYAPDPPVVAGVERTPRLQVVAHVQPASSGLDWASVWMIYDNETGAEYVVARTPSGVSVARAATSIQEQELAQRKPEPK